MSTGAASSNRGFANAVGEHLEGQRMGSHFLARSRTQHLDCDELYTLILQAQKASPDRLLGLARAVQKQIEREVVRDATT